jgi:hypothetical protein
MKKKKLFPSVITLILIAVFLSGCNEEKNIKPSASFTIDPSFADINIPIHLNSTSTDSDGQITNYTWLYNENLIGFEPNISLTFSETGSYSIKLIVTDDSGDSNTLEKTISIGNINFFNENLYGLWTWSGNNQTGLWTFYQNHTLKATFTGEAGASVTDWWHWEVWLNTSKIYFDEPNDQFWRPAAYGFEFFDDFKTLKLTYNGSTAFWYKVT